MLTPMQTTISVSRLLVWRKNSRLNSSSRLSSAIPMLLNPEMMGASARTLRTGTTSGFLKNIAATGATQ